MFFSIPDKTLNKRNASIQQLSMQINEILCLINEQITAENPYRVDSIAVPNSLFRL